MNKNKYYKFLCGIAIILIAAFLISVVIDYSYYNSLVTSAPFYVSIIVRAIEFLLPSAIMFIIAIIYKKKNKS